MPLQDFLLKNVKVTKRDGYLKFGTLMDVSDSFIELKFRDGRTEFINKSEISQVILDKGDVDD